MFDNVKITSPISVSSFIELLTVRSKRSRAICAEAPLVARSLSRLISNEYKACDLNSSNITTSNSTAIPYSLRSQAVRKSAKPFDFSNEKITIQAGEETTACVSLYYIDVPTNKLRFLDSDGVVSGPIGTLALSGFALQPFIAYDSISDRIFFMRTNQSSQRLIFTNATSGTFTASFNGNTLINYQTGTPQFPYNTQLANIHVALQSHVPTGATLSVTGPAGGPFIITFAGTGISVPDLSINVSGLNSGASATITRPRNLYSIRPDLTEEILVTAIDQVLLANETITSFRYDETSQFFFLGTTASLIQITDNLVQTKLITSLSGVISFCMKSIYDSVNLRYNFFISILHGGQIGTGTTLVVIDRIGTVIKSAVLKDTNQVAVRAYDIIYDESRGRVLISYYQTPDITTNRDKGIGTIPVTSPTYPVVTTNIVSNAVGALATSSTRKMVLDARTSTIYFSSVSNLNSATQLNEALIPSSSSTQLATNLDSGLTTQFVLKDTCNTTSDCQSLVLISKTTIPGPTNQWANGCLLSNGYGLVRINTGEIDPCGDGSNRTTLLGTFTSLLPNTIFSLKFDRISGVGDIRIEMHSEDEDQQSTTTFVFVDSYTTGAPVGLRGPFEITLRGTRVSVTMVAVTATAANPIVINNILVCNSTRPLCGGALSNVSCSLEWNGVPRQEINCFDVIMRTRYRDTDDYTDTIIATDQNTSVAHTALTLGTCDVGNYSTYWKSQFNSGTIPLFDSGRYISLGGGGNALLVAVVAASTQAVSSYPNWSWAIPSTKTATTTDSLMVRFPDTDVGIGSILYGPLELQRRVVERIEFLILLNTISTVATPACPDTYAVTDPATTLNVVLRYRNSLNRSKEFTQTIAISDIYASTNAASDWDTQITAGRGMKGTTARWESFKFELDRIDGNGLDQCIEPVDGGPIGGDGTDGTGGTGGAGSDLDAGKFKKLTMRSVGTFRPQCDAAVVVDRISSGSTVNSIMTLVLPNPTGGTWTLTNRYQGIETTTLSWNVTIAGLRAAIGAFSTIGGESNVQVSGAGTAVNPFRIEFKGALAGKPIPLLTANGALLTGVSSGVVIKTRTGTINERQTITNSTNTTLPFTATFEDATSASISYNSSLNVMQTKLESMPSIGEGNVLVTGNITNRNAIYTGPWHVDFINELGGQNVPNLILNEENYTLTPEWNGGVGANDQQVIRIKASSGTFKLGFSDIGTSGGEVVYTTPIPITATESELGVIIANSISWIDLTELSIVKTTGLSANNYEWTIDFVGNLASTEVPQMLIDPSGLRGSDILIASAIAGSGSNERYRISLIRATAGSYKLQFDADGETGTTTSIIFTSTPAGLQAQILALEMFEPDDLTVALGTVNNPSVTKVYILTFKKRFTTLPTITPIFAETLLCNPLNLQPVDPGPYDYDLDDCTETNIGQICRPGPGDDIDPVEKCCDPIVRDSANYADLILINRDLVPATKVCGSDVTIGKLAASRGIRTSDYTVYTKSGSTLRTASYETIVTNQLSVVLVENTLSAEHYLRHISNKLNTTRGLLPLRS